MLGFPILYLKGMRIMMFQLSGFYFKDLGFGVQDLQALGLGTIIRILEVSGV